MFRNCDALLFEKVWFMMFLTPAQFFQLGRKCSHCDKTAKWLDKYEENRPAYCDEHFPYWKELSNLSNDFLENNDKLKFSAFKTDLR